MYHQNCFLCVDLAKKILPSIKLLIFLWFARNVYQRASIDRQKKDEGREGSCGSWRSWSSAGNVLMVGGLVLSSENRNDQGESGAERETDKDDFQAKRN